MIIREILHVCSNQNAVLVYSTDISDNVSANKRESGPCFHQMKLEIRAEQRKIPGNPKYPKCQSSKLQIPKFLKKIFSST